MDFTILKKRISSYRTEKGSLTKVPDELAMEILYAWEQWTGPASGFYQAIGITNPDRQKKSEEILYYLTQIILLADKKGRPSKDQFPEVQDVA